MNYQDLKAIMSHIRNKVTCPYCRDNYKDFGLNIVETFPDGSLIVGLCFQCKKPSLIEVQIMPEENPKPIKEDRIKIVTRKHNPISKSEISEMQTFLKKFNGDFKTLFTNKK